MSLGSATGTDDKANGGEKADEMKPVNPEIDTAVTAYVDKIFENYRNFCRICEK